MAWVRVEVLGGLRVLGPAGQVRPDWSLPRALVLVELVRHQGRTCARDDLVDAIWPDGPPPTAGSRLRNLVSAVRRVLEDVGVGGEAVRSRGGGWAIDLGVTCTLDLDELTQTVGGADDDVLRAAARGLDLPVLPEAGDDTAWVRDLRADAADLRDEVRARLRRGPGDAPATGTGSATLVREGVLRRVAADAGPAGLVLTGPPARGRSVALPRLVELAQADRRPVLAVAVTATAPTLQPLRDLVAAAVRAGTSVRRLVTAVPEVGAVLPGVAGVLPAPPVHGDRECTLLEHVLLHLAADGLVLVVDDIDHAPAEVLGVLRRVLGETPSRLLATAAPPTGWSAVLRDLAAACGLSVRELPPLDRREVQALLALTGDRAVSGEEARATHEATGGEPDLVIGVGTAGRGGTASLAGDLGRRLDRLGALRPAVEVAAVLASGPGGRVARDLWEVLLAVDDAAPGSWWADLRARDVLVGDAHEATFRIPLLARHVRDELGPGRRTALHAAAAAAAMARDGTGWGTDGTTAAHHLHAAGDASAIEEAVRLATIAAVEATGAHDHVGEADAWGLAATLLGPDGDPTRRGTMLTRRAVALDRGGDVDGARRAALSAVEVLRGRVDGLPLAAAALAVVAASEGPDGDPVRARALAAALAALPDDAPAPVRVELLTALADASPVGDGRRDRLRREADVAARLVADVAPDDPNDAVRGIHHAMRLALSSPRHRDRRLTATQDVAARAAATGDTALEIDARLGLLADHVMAARRPEVEAEVARLERLVDAFGSPRPRAHLAGFHAALAMARGDVEGVQAHRTAALAGWPGEPPLDLRAQDELLAASVALLRGDGARVFRASERCLRLLPWRDVATGLQAAARVLVGDRDGARATLDVLLATPAGHDLGRTYVTGMVAWTAAAVASPEQALAAAVLLRDRAEPLLLLGQSTASGFLGAADCWLADVWELAGDPERARVHRQDGEALLRAFGASHWAATRRRTGQAG